MIPISTTGMEPRIKQRFGFASSAFSRLYGVDHVTPGMMEFSLRWAKTDHVAPLQGLNEVDFYFKKLWDTSPDLL